MKPKLFQSTRDNASIIKVNSYRTNFILCVAICIFLILLALLPTEAYIEMFDVSKYDAKEIRVGIGFTCFCFGMIIAVISYGLFKNFSESRTKFLNIVEKLSIEVYEDEIRGICCDVDINAECKEFNIPLNDIVRVQVETEICNIGLCTPKLEVLCIYTQHEKIKIWAIMDAQLLSTNLNSLLLENLKKHS